MSTKQQFATMAVLLLQVGALDVVLQQVGFDVQSETVSALGVTPAASMYRADYAAWDRVLKMHVNTSGSLEGINLHTVDYCGIKADSDFQAFLDSLAVADTTDLSKEEFHAFYMNAYNALAVNMLIEHSHKTFGLGCVKSIRDIGSMLSSVWDKFAGVVGGDKMSLQGIEDLLRDPSSLGYAEDCRLHACIVCASISCPNVRAEAYLPETIDTQMSDNTRDWLSNSRKGSAVSNDVLTVSKIFSWYQGDFQQCSGSAAAFIAEYAPASVAEFTSSSGIADSDLQYFDYNWNANGEVPCSC